MTSTPAAPGRLTVQMPSEEAYLRAEARVIDSESLALVAKVWCGQTIEVPAGNYLVSVSLPSGQRRVVVTEIEPGGAAVAQFPSEAPPAPPPAPAVPTRGLDPGTFGGPDVRVRCFDVSRDMRIEAVEPRIAETPTATGLELEIDVVGGEGVLFAQVGLEDKVPLNVALPVAGPTRQQSCRLTVDVSGGSLTAEVSLPDNRSVDAVARYLQTGFLKEAAAVLDDAESLLEQKMADPFGAALGGYALLRLGTCYRLHEWPLNLSSWFPWLPDGAVIAGEKAAQEGNHALALGQLCEAAQRGLPVFADGLSLLTSRLKEYAGVADPPAGTDPALIEEAATHLARLQPYLPFVDFARVALAFPGEDLLRPAATRQTAGANV